MSNNNNNKNNSGPSARPPVPAVHPAPPAAAPHPAPPAAAPHPAPVAAAGLRLSQIFYSQNECSRNFSAYSKRYKTVKEAINDGIKQGELIPQAGREAWFVNTWTPYAQFRQIEVVWARPWNSDSKWVSLDNRRLKAYKDICKGLGIDPIIPVDLDVGNGRYRNEVLEYWSNIWKLSTRNGGTSIKLVS